MSALEKVVAGYAPSAPPPPVTLEDVLRHSDKLTEELGSLVRAALRIESTLTGYPPAPSGEDPEGAKPCGLVPGLHDNLCEVSQRISVLNSALGRIEDRLMEPKVAQATPGFAGLAVLGARHANRCA